MPTWYGHYLDELRWDLRKARETAPGMGRVAPVEGPIALECLFQRPDRRRCDLDNLLKGLLDAATGIIWRDDSQLREIHARVMVVPKTPLIWARFLEIDGGQ